MMNLHKLFYLLSLVCLLLGCQTQDGGTEIPNELTGKEFIAGSGKTAAEADIKLVPVGYVPGATGKDSNQAVFTAKTDANGEFVFKDVPAGQYNVLGAKDGLHSFRDSVAVTGKAQTLDPDSLKAPGSLAGTVRLQPQDDPRTATVEVLGTELFVNADSNGAFKLPDLAPGRYRIRAVTILPDYVPLYQEIEIRSGVDSTLPDPLVLFYAGIPVLTGLVAAPGPAGTVVLRWNKPAYAKVDAYLIYRDSASQYLPSQAPLGRTGDTVFIDTVYSKTPGPGQYPYYDTLLHTTRYRVRILDKSGAVGPAFGSAEATALPPSKNFASALWKLALANGPFPKQQYSTAIVFQDKIWLIGGGYNTDSTGMEIWNSADGLAWQQAPMPPWTSGNFQLIRPVVFANKLWVTASRWDTLSSGMINSLWNTANGSQWTPVDTALKLPQTDTASQAGMGSFVAFNNKLWIIDGDDYDPGIFSSPDGSHWTREKPSAGYYGQAYEGMVILGNTLFKVGGGGGGAGHAESGIFSTTDGINWSRIVDSAEFLPRAGHGLVAHAGKLWVIGGSGVFTVGGPYNDVWNSSDGITWTLADAHGPFSARAGQAAVSFHGRIWLIGGGNNTISYNDVWYMEGP